MEKDQWDMGTDIGNEFMILGTHISHMFSVLERNLCENKPDKRAERIDRFADDMIEFATEYVNSQREGMKQFTQKEIASRIRPPLN